MNQACRSISLCRSEAIGSESVRSRSGVATIASSERPLWLMHGGVLRHAELAYEIFGPHDASKTVLICHALTGDAHVTRHNQGNDAERSGWWESLVGPGRAVDTATTRVICTNVIGGCGGSTGPTSIDPQTGERFGPEFPTVTIQDIVAAQRRFIDFMGIRSLVVIGGTIRGLQALEWVRAAPDMVTGATIIAAGTALNAYGLAHNHTARTAILSDQFFEQGRYDPYRPPAGGLAAARHLAHLTYRTSDAFERRFAREVEGDRIAVQSYHDYKWASFVERFDANSYLTLLDAMDRYDAERDGTLTDSLRRFDGRLLLAGLSTDLLFPSEQSERLAKIARRAGARCDLEIIDTDEGHDAFLMPSVSLDTAVRGLLIEGCER